MPAAALACYLAVEAPFGATRRTRTKIHVADRYKGRELPVMERVTTETNAHFARVLPKPSDNWTSAAGVPNRSDLCRTSGVPLRGLATVPGAKGVQRMWAQLITVRLKPGREGDLPKLMADVFDGPPDFADLTVVYNKEY